MLEVKKYSITKSEEGKTMIAQVAISFGLPGEDTALFAVKNARICQGRENIYLSMPRMQSELGEWEDSLALPFPVKNAAAKLILSSYLAGKMSGAAQEAEAATQEEEPPAPSAPPAVAAPAAKSSKPAAAKGGRVSLPAPAQDSLECEDMPAF